MQKTVFTFYTMSRLGLVAAIVSLLFMPSLQGTVEATGGTVKFFDGYMIHTFTNSGTFTVTQGGNVDVLVVGGGGGGGYSQQDRKSVV